MVKAIILFFVLMFSYNVIANAVGCLVNKTRLSLGQSWGVVITMILWSVFYFLSK